MMVLLETWAKAAPHSNPSKQSSFMERLYVFLVIYNPRLPQVFSQMLQCLIPYTDWTDSYNHCNIQSFRLMASPMKQTEQG